MPVLIQDYLEMFKVRKLVVPISSPLTFLCLHAQFDSTVNRIVNRVIKERPGDPLSEIAKYLLQQSRKTYPIFDKLKARRVFIGGDNPSSETLRISVYLYFHGRSGLRYQYYFSYDPEEQNLILYDDQDNKTGLTQGADMISRTITDTIRLNLGARALDINA